MAALYFFCVAAVAVALAGEAPAQVRDEGPIKLGTPLLVRDIALGETRCWRVDLGVARQARLMASAVGLVGTPSLWGGWGPSELATLLPSDGSPDAVPSGFDTFWEELSDADFEQEQAKVYRVCARTFSPEGCVMSLTVQIGEGASGPYPAVSLKPAYPSVWPLALGDTGIEKDAALPTLIRLELRVDDLELDEIRVSAVPLSGESELKVYDASCEVFVGGVDIPEALASSALQGPDLVDVMAGDNSKLCIEVSGKGIVAVTAGPRLLLPIIAPEVPAASRFDYWGDQSCEQMRLFMSPHWGMTVTATAADNSQLQLSASVGSSTLANQWESDNMPGGEGGVLVLHAPDVLAKAGGGDEVVTLTISVCPGVDKSSDYDSRFWLAAVADRGVATLDDGVPWDTVGASKTLDPVGGESPSLGAWRFFRFLVPAGKFQPKEITVSASSSCAATLSADTRYLNGRASAYRWGGSGANTSHPVLHLTTRSHLASKHAYLIDCKLFPCFLYIAAAATCNGGVGGDLQVVAMSDKAGITPLFEGIGIEQTLLAGESQLFRYTVLDPDANVLIAASTKSGTLQFEVSSRPSFPEDTRYTSTPADEVVMLEPHSAVYASALDFSDQAYSDPIIYVRVRATAKDAATTFTIGARAEGDDEVLRNGDDAVNGAVEGQGTDRYRFYIDESAARRGLDVSVKVHLFVGSPRVYIACEPNRFPSEEWYTWGGRLDGQDTIVFNTADPKFRPGWVYVGVSAGDGRAAYSIQVHWGNASVVLQDGVELTGHVPGGKWREYVIEAGSLPDEGQVLALRGQALTGKVRMCIGEQRVCTHDIQVSDEGEEASLASLDIPFLENMGDLFVRVQGLTKENSFALRASVTAPAKLAEDHNLVIDSLGPRCCVSGDAWMQVLRRSYQSYVHPTQTDSVVAVEVNALGAGNFAGARLLLRRAQYTRQEQYEGQVKTYEAFLPDNESARHIALAGGAEELGGPHRPTNGFWVEVRIEAIRPVNFTISLRCVPQPAALGGDTSGQAPTVASDLPVEGSDAEEVGMRLLPNVPVKRGIEELNVVDTFEMSLPGGGEKMRLGLRQCFGKAAVRWTKQSSAVWEQATPAGVDEDFAWVLQSAEGALGEVVEVYPNSAPPVVYEVEVMPHGKTSFIQLPESTELEIEAHAEQGYVAVSFIGAVNRRADLKGFKLKYELMALEAGDDRLNAASTCGLVESASRSLASVSPVEDSSVEAATAPGILRPSRIPAKWFAKPGIFKLNILARLWDPQGMSIAERCYTPISVNTTELFKGSKLITFSAQDQGKPPQNILGWIAMLLLGVMCYRSCNKKTAPASDGQANGLGASGRVGENVEMEENFYSYQEVYERRGLMSRGGSGNYVPPTV